MQLVHVGAAVLNQTPLDWNGNRDRIVSAIEIARNKGISVICLPELCISGYGCEDAFQSPGVQRMAWTVLEEIVPFTHGVVVAIGLPVRFESGVYDAVAVVVNGKIEGVVAKQHLAGDGIHYEPRWFRAWPAGRRVIATFEGHRVPFGDFRFDCGGVRIGFEICEDAWAAARPGAALASRGVDLLLNPSASHFAFAKNEVRRRFVLEGSRAFGVTYIYTNLLGNESGRAIYDGGVLIATLGRMVTRGKRFGFCDVSVADAVVDLDATRLFQSRVTHLAPSLQNDSKDCIDVPFVVPFTTQTESAEVTVGYDSWEDSPSIKEEEFTRAVGLGLIDYLRKSRSSGFVVSASGGADSSAVACLVSLAVERGVREQSLEKFASRIGLAGEVLSKLCNSQPSTAVRELIRQVLTCVYQSTANSSVTTRTAASVVAQAIGAEFLEFDVDQIVCLYEQIVSKAIDRSLEWNRDDIARQNIQARVRSPGIWMLANIRNSLLVSTSNRSEAAVGYATMDGDTSGGIAPIAGIDKAYLRDWLLWLETTGPQDLGPIAALKSVNDQSPTAELRPPRDLQTDEADLMPYDVLDAAERAAIRDKQTPLEVWRKLVVAFPAHSPRQLSEWTERFFRLWSRNQWKRERYAPSFHLDDEDLDPKSWCRFPILSGGFDRELAELRIASGLATKANPSA
ncbi:MAG: NAD(+) synthase [Planctomycetaceae bacterium]|nr:MAG: NAD(+) synthase [Planctomycetaceae bacterium]